VRVSLFPDGRIALKTSVSGVSTCSDSPPASTLTPAPSGPLGRRTFHLTYSEPDPAPPRVAWAFPPGGKILVLSPSIARTDYRALMR
jgi:hypothetical protein